MRVAAKLEELHETLEAKLKRHEDALIACMAEITKLREENGRLRATAKATAGAHDVLREIYLDPDAPPALRAKCAIGALPHETPGLEPVPAPLELVAEPIEPLADVVARQRARADRMLLEDPQFRAVRSYQAMLKGNGSDDSND
jgi:hypothetical protein